jgi:hypothetical protein
MKQSDYPPEILELLEFARLYSPGPVAPTENHTVPLELIAVRPLNSSCEDCDRQLDQPRKVYSKRLVKPYPHWSKQCQSCKFYQCNITGEYSLTNVELRHQHLLAAGLQIPQPRVPGARGRPPGAKNQVKNAQEDK